MALGRLVYGLGVMALGVIGVVWGDFVSGQPVAKGFPERAALAYVAGALLLAGGAAVEWRRTAKWGAAALTAYYAVVVLVLMNGHVVLKHYKEFGVYEGLAEQVAIATGALLVYATFAEVGAVHAARLMQVGQRVFGVCGLVFGAAHFVYMDLTAPLVPRWLPPSQTFWGYATGIGFVLAGLALLTGLKARLAAILLTGMMLSFTVLVHVRMLMAGPRGVGDWTELAINVTVAGAAWVVADSLRRTESFAIRPGA